MNNKRFIMTGIGLSVLLGLSACGGGSSSNSTTLPASVTSGPITAFGSIYVNGTEINTDKAKIYIEGKPASESDLRVGMMVDVVQDGSGSALEVHFADDVEAIVFANNIPAGELTGTLNVMGFNVTVDVDTVFDSRVDTITDVSQIAEGNIIEVSGYSTGTGEVTATRIEVVAASLADYLASHSDGMEIKGLVSNHDATAQTFDLGPLTVDYSGARLEDLPDGITDGIFVEVKSVEGLNADNQLIASKVEQERKGYEDDHGDDGDEYEMTGKVVEITDTSITVDDTTFLITNRTEFENDDDDHEDGEGDSEHRGGFSGSTPIEVGMIVEIEGRYNSDGDLVAKEIEVKGTKMAPRVELKGVIDSITVEDTNIGSLTLSDGTVINVNNDTIMKDDRHSMSPDYHFNLTDLVQGDYIEVYAYSNTDGSYTARKLEREDNKMVAMP